MERPISQLSQNLKIVFDKGKFDEWCVFIIENNKKYAPRDLEYFSDLKKLALKYSNLKLYTDFIKIYNDTNSKIENKVVELISKIAEQYNPEDHQLIKKWFTVIYAGMVAEENKRFAKLKKRIKHLGIYQLLMLESSPAEAASFSKGKKWQELDSIMKEHGI